MHITTARRRRAKLGAFSESITLAEAIELSLASPRTTDAERFEVERIGEFLGRHGVVSEKQQASLRAILARVWRGHGSS